MEAFDETNSIILSLSEGRTMGNRKKRSGHGIL